MILERVDPTPGELPNLPKLGPSPIFVGMDLTDGNNGYQLDGHCVHAV